MVLRSGDASTAQRMNQHATDRVVAGGWHNARRQVIFLHRECGPDRRGAGELPWVGLDAMLKGTPCL